MLPQRRDWARHAEHRGGSRANKIGQKPTTSSRRASVASESRSGRCIHSADFEALGAPVLATKPQPVASPKHPGSLKLVANTGLPFGPIESPIKTG